MSAMVVSHEVINKILTGVYKYSSQSMEKYLLYAGYNVKQLIIRTFYSRIVETLQKQHINYINKVLG